jgi:two-component system, chemotaxis family, sensor kinase CheA
MDRREELRREMLVTFQAELEEHVGAANKTLLRMEEGPPPEEMEFLVAEILRAAHSLKGAARVVDVPDVETIFHAMEDVLTEIRDEAKPMTRPLFDVFFTFLDAANDAMSAKLREERLPRRVVEKLIEQLKEAAEAPAEAPPEAPAARRPDVARPPAVTAPPRAEPPTGTEPVPPPPRPAESTPEEPPPDRPPAQCRRGPPRGPGSEDTIRMSTAKLDALMAGLGQLLVSRMRIEQRLTELRAVQTQLSRWEKKWRKVRRNRNRLQRLGLLERDSARLHTEGTSALVAHDVSPLLNFLNKNEEHLDSAGADLTALVRNFDADYAYMALLTDDLQEVVRRVRMLPVATLFDRFPRMVRDVARKQDKDVMLEVEGAQTEVDRQVLELIADPLTHMLRNSVAHGIETAARREDAGKPRRGRVCLRALQRGNNIVLEVEDDGAGLNTAAIRRVAVQRGVASQQEVDRFSDRDAVDLIFRSGLSTQTKSDDISGRGVGLDVVRENLEKLNGQIGVESTPGEGTRFTMTLPLTMATSHVLLVEVAGQTVAVPTTTVLRILRQDPAAVGNLEGKQVIRLDDRPIPLVSMAQLLKLENEALAVVEGQKMPVVVLAVAEKQVAFHVDRFLGTQVLVIKQMGRQLRRVRNVAGGSILGDGSVVVVLNVADLMKSSEAGATVSVQRPVKVQEASRSRVLVVDDSITTRTLEKNILLNSGYDVLVAADGAEAWGIIQTEHLDAVVSDVDMPNMDGFTLCETIRADDRFAELPIVLVTSKEKREDRLHGLEAGADAYMTKSTFDQGELLDTLERLIG